MGRDKDHNTVARCTYVDESAQNDGQASKYLDIFYIRDCYSNNVGLYGDSPGGDETRCKKDLGGPLRTLGASTWAPIARGLTCRVYVKSRASSR